MTNRLELSWDVDGFFDEQRYYCSTSPIDINNLPVPKVVLTNDARTYTDTAITAGATYYVCIGSVKNGVEKLSDIIQIVASNDPFDTYVLSNLALSSDLTDKKGVGWTPSKPATFTDNALTFDGSFRIYASSLATPNYNAANYNVQCLIKPSRLDLPYQNLFCKRDTATTYAEFLARLEGNKVLITACSGNTWYSFKGSTSLTTSSFYKIEMDRKGNIVTLYINDVAEGSFTLPNPVSLNSGGAASKVTLGALGDGTDPFYGLMRDFKITHGSSRH